jgi:aspartyl-tRNA synthetase
MSEKYDYRQKIEFKNFVTDLRSNLCGQLDSSFIGKTVTLCGWINKRRDHGKLIFIDLRDFSGIIQIVFDSNNSHTAYDMAKDFRSEFIISVQGEVKARSAEAINPELPTGEIEIIATNITLLSASKTPPFMIDNRAKVDEMSRLKYR